MLHKLKEKPLRATSSKPPRDNSEHKNASQNVRSHSRKDLDVTLPNLNVPPVRLRQVRNSRRDKPRSISTLLVEEQLRRQQQDFSSSKRPKEQVLAPFHLVIHLLVVRQGHALALNLAAGEMCRQDEEETHADGDQGVNEAPESYGGRFG